MADSPHTSSMTSSRSVFGQICVWLLCLSTILFWADGVKVVVPVSEVRKAPTSLVPPFLVRSQAILISNDSVETQELIRGEVRMFRFPFLIHEDVGFDLRDLERFTVTQEGLFRGYDWGFVFRRWRQIVGLVNKGALRVNFGYAGWCSAFDRSPYQEIADFLGSYGGYEHPRAFRIYDRLGIQQSRVCNGSSVLGLLLDISQSTDSHYSSDDSDYEEANIGQVFRGKQTTEIALRVICGPIFLLCGCLLIYYVSPNSWRGRGLFALGVLLIGLGFGAFFLPVYYQDARQHERNRDPFHGQNYTTESFSVSRRQR
jgi:hypothetical protein